MSTIKKRKTIDLGVLLALCDQMVEARIALRRLETGNHKAREIDKAVRANERDYWKFRHELEALWYQHHSYAVRCNELELEKRVESEFWRNRADNAVADRDRQQPLGGGINV